MKWVWKIKPLDPATTTPEQLAAAKRLHERGRWIGTVVGIITAFSIYHAWNRLGYENKWVEYTMFPAIVIGGALSYRIVYEMVIRFEP
jgi:hypothetical protein